MTSFKMTLAAIFLSLSAVSLPLFADPVTQASSGTVSDTDIISDIQKQISDNAAINGLQLTVNSVNGLVTLTGTVGTGEQASTLAELAEATKGVKDIDVSKLILQSSNQPASLSFGDAILTAKVQGTFMREKLFDVHTVAEMPIQLEVTNGVVYLSGVAETPMQLNKAIAIAQSVSGVTSVTSKVTLRNNH